MNANETKILSDKSKLEYLLRNIKYSASCGSSCYEFSGPIDSYIKQELEKLGYEVVQNKHKWHMFCDGWCTNDTYTRISW